MILAFYFLISLDTVLVTMLIVWSKRIWQNSRSAFMHKSLNFEKNWLDSEEIAIRRVLETTEKGVETPRRYYSSPIRKVF